MTFMLVSVTGFGSVWRRRIGKDPNDSSRFVNAAYYNTTGVLVNNKIGTRPRIIGHARFNGVGGFNPNYPSRMINRVFDCAAPCVWMGQNKVLFKRMLPAYAPPDYFLVIARHDETGHLEIGDAGWKSDDTLLLSFSEFRAQQEAMLLMVKYSWIRGGLGTFFLEPHCQMPWGAALRLACSA